MSRTVRSLLAAVVVTALVLGAGLLVLGLGDGSGGSGDAGDPAASGSGAAPVEPSDVPLADFDTSDVALVRDSFCDRVPDESVTDVLGADATDATAWGNGDDVDLPDGSSDVAHEYGCRWEATARGRSTVAEGWVYAPPVTAAEAKDHVASASRAGGCSVPNDAPAFGRPSLALVCPSGQGDDATTSVSFRGLFGDAWLVCQLTTPGEGEVPDLLDAAGRWCVTLARAAAA